MNHNNSFDFVKKPLLLLLTLTLCSCTAVHDIKIVDKHGVPIEGVLVIADKGPYLSSFKRSVGLSDSNGVVDILRSYLQVLIYKPGYYPFVDGSMVPKAPEWGRRSLGRTITLSQVPDRTEEVTVKNIKSTFDENDQGGEINHEKLSDKVTMSYDISSEIVEVEAKEGWVLHKAERFYFDYAQYLNESIKMELREKKVISFFLRNAKGVMYKVLVGRTGHGIWHGVKTARFDILISDSVDYNDILYPKIKDWDYYNMHSYGAKGDPFIAEGEPELFIDGEYQLLKTNIHEYMSPHFLGYPSAFYAID